MRRQLATWLLRYRFAIAGGAALWVVLVAAAGWTARVRGVPVLPQLVTWSEWTVAVMLLPALVTTGSRGLNAVGRPGRARATMEGVVAGAGLRSVERHAAEEQDRLKDDHPPGVVRFLSIAAGVVFVLDLVLRALFRLGWEPFL